MAETFLPAAIADARRRQARRRRRIAALLTALAAVAVATYMIGFPGGSSGPPPVPRSGSAGPGPQAPGPLKPGSHLYTYAQAVAAHLPGVTKYDPQLDPAKCVRNAHWSCKGGAMYCPRDIYTQDGGYKTAAALEAAIEKAPKDATCTSDPRDVVYGFGADAPVHHSLDSTPAGRDLLRYTDGVFHWQISYPRRFQARGFFVDGFHGSDRGISIANFAPPPDPGFRTDTGGRVEIPATGVVLQLEHADGPFSGGIGGPEAHLPLRLADFATTPSSAGRSTEQLTYAFSVDGVGLRATLTFGSRATGADKTALAAVVASFRVPALITGTVTPTGFFVLRAASAYPLGSVTRVDPASTAEGRQYRLQPFYLVHDADGFRAIGWPDNMFPPHYKPPCDVRYDAKTRELSCPDGQRWDLRARDFRHFHQAKLYRPLYLYDNGIGHDGRVLVSEDGISSPR